MRWMYSILFEQKRLEIGSCQCSDQDCKDHRRTSSMSSAQPQWRHDYGTCQSGTLARVGGSWRNGDVVVQLLQWPAWYIIHYHTDNPAFSQAGITHHAVLFPLWSLSGIKDLHCVTASTASSSEQPVFKKIEKKNGSNSDNVKVRYSTREGTPRRVWWHLQQHCSSIYTALQVWFILFSKRKQRFKTNSIQI